MFVCIKINRALQRFRQECNTRLCNYQTYWLYCTHLTVIFAIITITYHISCLFLVCYLASAAHTTPPNVTVAVIGYQLPVPALTEPCLTYPVLPPVTVITLQCLLSRPDQFVTHHTVVWVVVWHCTIEQNIYIYRLNKMHERYN